jgi:predicted metal-dependent peptidase
MDDKYLFDAEADLRLRAARFRALQEWPYFATAMCSMSFYQVKGMGTIGVDKYWRVVYDPETIKSWHIDELRGALYHEVGHNLRDHAGRQSDIKADHQLFNVAGDLEINDDAKADGAKLPSFALYPSTYGYADNLTAEKYYELLMNDPKVKKVSTKCQSGQGDGGDKDGDGKGKGDGEGQITAGGCGSCAGGIDKHKLPDDGNMLDEGEREAITRDTARRIEEHAKQQGNVPAGWKRWAEQKLKSKVNYKDLLRAAIRGTVTVPGKQNFSWQRPARRQAAYGNILMPTMRSVVPRVGMLVDTSGSMSDSMLSQALAEIDGVLQTLGRSEIIVAACDAAVHSTQKVMSAAQVELHGGGGTDMTEGIMYMDRMRPRIDTLIVVTDGYTGWPTEHPQCNLLLVMVAGGGLPPWPCKHVKIDTFED